MSETANNPYILLALFEDDEVQAFADLLKTKGHETRHVSDGARAMDMILKDPPTLIVVDTLLPVVNGERLFQTLKDNPHTKNIPFLFISYKQAEIKGFRGGTDIFIIRPFQWEEVYGYIKQALHFSIKEGAKFEEKHIQGNLSHMPLVDILQVLDFNKKEGTVTITHGKEKAVIYVKGGQVCNVTLGKCEGEKAVYRIFTWNEGSFVFEPVKVTMLKKIDIPTGNLLMEGMRQLDELEKSSKIFPADSDVLRAKVDTSALPKGLKPIIYEVLLVLGTHSRVKDIVDKCKVPDLEVYQTIQNLIERKILEKTDEVIDESKVVEEFIAPGDALKIKDKVIAYGSDRMSVSHGYIFVISTSTDLSRNLMRASVDISGFHPKYDLLDDTNLDEYAMGETGHIRLYGELDMIFFALAPMAGLWPLQKSFLSHLTGVLVLWDERGEATLEDIQSIKNLIALKKDVIVRHVYCGGGELDDNSKARYAKAFDLSPSDSIDIFSSISKNGVVDMFKSFFNEMAVGTQRAEGS
ncbi:MAG: DUF4388 domain-containing protein [Deltaproteobacteria bacterium]|nr:DUF4388 domain-containing protein [Deltaproteobacteria bacterium]